jgi:hypothetical protein
LTRPGLRPEHRRSDFDAGFLRNLSLDGDLDESCESEATCRSNSAIRWACFTAPDLSVATLPGQKQHLQLHHQRGQLLWPTQGGRTLLIDSRRRTRAAVG